MVFLCRDSTKLKQVRLYTRCPIGSAKESGTAQWSLTRPSGWIVKAAKPQTPIVECEIQIIIETNNDES